MVNIQYHKIYFDTIFKKRDKYIHPIHPKMNGVSKVVTNLCDSGRAALLSVATAGK